MKHQRKNKRLWMLAILLLTGGLLTGCARGSTETTLSAPGNGFQSVTSVNADMVDSMLLTGSGLSVRLEYGLHGSVKYNRYMKVSAEITNQGNDFSGWLQVILPFDDENHMYRKEFQVQEGSTEKLLLVLPTSMSNSRMLVSVNRLDGEEICSKTFRLNMVYSPGVAYIGVYSDKQEQFGYMEGMDSKVFYLQKEELVDDYKAYDILDVIVISDQDGSTFSKMQVKAIVSWVKRGGTLVLADSGKHKELKLFTNKQLSWKAGKTETIKTAFGMDASDSELIIQRQIQKLEAKKAEQVKQFLMENLSVKLYSAWSGEIADIQENSYCLGETGEIFSYLRDYYSDQEIKEHLSLSATDEEKAEMGENLFIPVIKRKLTHLKIDGAEDVMAVEGDRELLQKTAMGLGNVIVSGCSLAMKEDYWDVLGNEVLEKITDSLSKERKQQLQMEEQWIYGSENYVYRQGLLVTETDGLPNLNLYVGILIVYILLIGPVLFFLFRRKRKSRFLWGVIPAVSILFSIFIYLIGTSTRIREPYVNYLSHLQLGENGQAILKNWFRIASSSNDPYEVVLKGNCDVEPLVADSGYQIISDEDNGQLDNGYQYGIEYGIDQTKISMMELSAFQGKNFQDEEVVDAGGDIVTDLAYSEMSLQGTVTNQFPYDLEDCILYDKGTVFYLGSIGQGESISVESVYGDDVYQQSKYNYDYDDLAIQLFGSNYWTSGQNMDCERRKRAVLMEGCLEEVASSKTMFLGFVSPDSDVENVFMDKFSFDKYGVMCVSKQIEVHYTSNGMELLPDISEYAVSYDSSVTDGKMIKDISQNRIQVSYRLPKGYQWKGLIYNQTNNAEFSYYNNGYLSTEIFEGMVTMIDSKTGQETLIIESGRETNMELTSADIGSNGTLTLYYYLDVSTGNGLQLPNIMVSVVKE